MLPAVIDYQLLQDGQELSLGDLTIRVLHTPGHTLGQVNFLATDGQGQSYAFTGDNIFIQSFGRPDLGGQGEAWAPIVYDTIFHRFKENVPENPGSCPAIMRPSMRPTSRAYLPSPWPICGGIISGYNLNTKTISSPTS